MKYYEVLFYIEFIGRNALALAMMILLMKRYRIMQQMGKANSDVRKVTPSSYLIRSFLLLINCILMIITISLYYLSNELEEIPFNFYKYCWTLIFLVAINTLQVIAMRKEYRRQVSYMTMHQVYWFLDLILYCSLFVAEVSQVEQGKMSLPVARIVVKIFVFGFSYYKKTNSIRVLEKSFLTQASRYLADMPSTTARSGIKIVSTLNTQPDAGRTQIQSPKKSLKSSHLQKEDEDRIKIVVKYQFHMNKKGEVFYVLDCQDFLKQGNKVSIKKNMQEFLQLQKDINSIKNPLNLTNFSYVSSQIINEQKQSPNNPNIESMPQQNEPKSLPEEQIPTTIYTDRNCLDENSNTNVEELKVEENGFKQILSLQKYLDYVMKEFYFEEVFLVKFLGLTRKQYYQVVSQLQVEDQGFDNETEFAQFKEEYPKLKHAFSVCPITKVSLDTLGNIRNDGVTYYQVTLRKKSVSSSLALPSYSQPLRYTDFYNFYKSYQKEIFPIRLPDFPPKSILNDKDTMYQRKQILLKFLSIIYNENIYFSNTLFSFQNCFQDYMIQKAQHIPNDLYQYSVNLQGKYLNSSKQFLFKFFQKRQSKKTFFIVKRFKDIINLHKDIELYYSNLLQYLVQEAYKSFKEKQLNVEIDPQFSPQVQEEKNILKEIKKTIKLPSKPKNINDCASYLQEVLDCNIYHKCISLRQFLFRFEYLEELLNENPNSSICFSKGQSYDDRNLQL